MLEKLNFRFIKVNKKLDIYELELFLELLKNHLSWEQILDILNIPNNEVLILKRIDNDAYIINQICNNKINKADRIRWLIHRTITKRLIIQQFNKSFIYPIFLWLLSLNLITFLMLYIMPSTIRTFNSFSNINNSLNNLILVIQFIIGVQWGMILIIMFVVSTYKYKKITSAYLKLFNKNNKNIFVYLVSYLYLIDLVSLMNLNLNIDTQMNILKQIEFPMYLNISDKVIDNLKKGVSIKHAFDYLDSTFLKIIAIEDYERKMDERIFNYLIVLRKQIDISIKKYANLFTSIVYIQIGVMVFIVYTILLYPLKLLEGMNL